VADAPTPHRSLARQLRRLGLCSEQLPPDAAAWQELLGAVSTAYEEADKDRYTLERSLEVSSTEMRALHDALSHRARHDALTGLPNRAALKEILQGVLGGDSCGAETAVLFIDLDGFKLINDTLGHAVGDELLIRASERIRAVLRPEDVASRLGGDEFVVLCPDVDGIDTAVGIARRIGDQLQTPFRLAGEIDASVSSSIGIALAVGQTGADELLTNADMAMYEAKSQGKARYTVFDEAMRGRAATRLDTENALWRAVDQGELVLHYQPIIDLHDGRVTAAEALVRWNRPGHGLLPPAAFVPIAEQSRLITAIDAWALREACRAASRWPDPALGVSVNLSTRDVQGEEFLAVLADVLRETTLDPRRLTLELTETAMMTDDRGLVGVLTEAGRMGVQVVVDDFGAGYWSMAQLRRLPVQALKIDRTIAADVVGDATAAAIAGAIVAMGHALGLYIVAEGVEDADQARALTALGCDAAQGYFFARPAPGTPSLLPVPAAR
jgi:diguanylate cyclase